MTTEGMQENSFDKRSLDVVKSFLQTAVILDDLAEMGQPSDNLIHDSPAVSTPLVEPSLSDPPEETSDNDSPGMPSDPDSPLNAKKVIDGFAENGLVCAVLRPDKTEPNNAAQFRKMVATAARRTDILVLDWRLGDFNEGEATLEVIDEVLKGDGNSNRMRLVAIYTGEPNLDVISEKVQPVVTQSSPDFTLDASNPMVLKHGPLRVALFAKIWAEARVRDDRKDRVVSEQGLANRLIEEFSEMTRGLLSNVAVAGLAALREEAHRLLAQFGKDLDAGYLGHRILLTHPPEAEDHLHEALSAELLSILEDRRPGKEAGIEAIREWLDQQRILGLDLQKPLNLTQGKDYLGTWTELLDNGNGTGEDRVLSNSQWDQLEGKSTEIFVNDPSNAIDSNQHFSFLMGFKTQYSTHIPRLTLGTVLSFTNCSGTSYFLCLQPKCDGVRLRGKTGFPLLPLISKDNSNGNAKFRMVVKDPTQQWLYFDYKPKARDLVIRSFFPGPYPPGEVIASKSSDRCFFKDSDGRKYTWVAAMKDEQALRVAAELATSLSRPGPNDAEWLRLASPSKTT